MSDSRFASIGGILSRPSNQTQQRNQSTETPRDDVRGGEDPASDVVEAHAPGPARNNTESHPSTATGDRRSAESNGGVRRVALRLDPSLHQGLAARVAAERKSQGEVVLDAIEGSLESGRLADLIEEEHNFQQGQGLFPRLRPRGRPTASIPVELRLDARAVAALDELAKNLGAESRTELIAVALKEQLKASGV